MFMDNHFQDTNFHVEKEAIGRATHTACVDKIVSLWNGNVDLELWKFIIVTKCGNFIARTVLNCTQGLLIVEFLFI